VVSAGSGQELQVGDVVTLTAGGPRMSVAKVNDNLRQVECIWHTKDDQVERDWFPLASLRRVLDTPPVTLEKVP